MKKGMGKDFGKGFWFVRKYFKGDGVNNSVKIQNSLESVSSRIGQASKESEAQDNMTQYSTEYSMSFSTVTATQNSDSMENPSGTSTKAIRVTPVARNLEKDFGRVVIAPGTMISPSQDRNDCIALSKSSHRKKLHFTWKSLLSEYKKVEGEKGNPADDLCRHNTEVSGRRGKGVGVRQDSALSSEQVRRFWTDVNLQNENPSVKCKEMKRSGLKFSWLSKTVENHPTPSITAKSIIRQSGNGDGGPRKFESVHVSTFK